MNFAEILTPYKVLAKNVGLEHDVSPKLILAIIYQESKGVPWITRYEPDYHYLYKTQDMAHKLQQTEETIIKEQKTSWGLMQIMGAVAHELGHPGYLSELVSPATNLYWSAKLLKKLQCRYNAVSEVIASYNAGSPRQDGKGFYVNQKYVDSVLTYMGDVVKWV